ncbi:MAG: hypothetical protein KatS3mg090_0765 [Patescibacteria group bacterium]|nr:MAG: hypothetical protein KatS3mg090_0765 [Patescibacteria group bacterium]
MKRFFKGLFFGSIIGYIIGVLTAPEEGKKTRTKIKKEVSKLQKEIKDKELDKKAKEFFGKLTETTKETYLQIQKETINFVNEMRKNDSQTSFDKVKSKITAFINEIKDRYKLSKKQTKKISEEITKKVSATKKANGSK